MLRGIFMNDFNRVNSIQILSMEEDQIDIGQIELKYPQDYFLAQIKNIRSKALQHFHGTDSAIDRIDFYQLSRNTLEKILDLTYSTLPIEEIIKRLLQSQAILGGDCQPLIEWLFAIIFEKTKHDVQSTLNEIIKIFNEDWHNQQRKKKFITCSIAWLSKNFQPKNPLAFNTLFEALNDISMENLLKILLNKETLCPSDFEFLVAHCIDNLLKPNFHAKKLLTHPFLFKSCVTRILSPQKKEDTVHDSAEKLACLDALLDKTFISTLHNDACTVTNKPLFLARYYIQVLNQASENSEKLQRIIFKTARLFLTQEPFIEYVIELARNSLSENNKKQLIKTLFTQGFDLSDKHIRYLMDFGENPLCLSHIEALFWQENTLIAWDDEKAEERCFNTFCHRSDFKALLYKRDLSQIEKEQESIETTFENYYSYMTDSLLCAYRNTLTFESGDFQSSQDKTEQTGEAVIVTIDSVPGIAILGGTGYIKQAIRQFCTLMGQEIIKHKHQQINTFFHSEKEATNILHVAIIRIIRNAIATGNTAYLVSSDHLQTIKKNIIASNELPTQSPEKIDFIVHSVFPEASAYHYAKTIGIDIKPKEKYSIAEAVSNGVSDYNGWGFFHGGKASIETRNTLISQTKVCTEEELLRLIENILEKNATFRHKSLNTKLTVALLDTALILKDPHFKQLKNAYESALNSPEIMAVSKEKNSYCHNKKRSLALKAALHEINHLPKEKIPSQITAQFSTFNSIYPKH